MGNNMKLKKGSKAAKDFMAKIRAKRKKNVSGWKKGKTSIIEMDEKKPKKAKKVVKVIRRKTYKPGTFRNFVNVSGTSHKDTKSHNVNIRVVSGLNQNLQTLNDIKYLMQRVEQYEKSIKILNTIPLKIRSKFDIMALSKYKQNLKSTKQALRELKKAIKF